MASTFMFPRERKITRKNLLLDATIRDFSGGWNVIDNDLNLDTKFSKVLENMQRGIDGANAVRPGTELFAETEEHLDEIINCEYFSGHIVAVGRNGKIVRIDATGAVTLIWDDNFASSLAGNPDGWSITIFCSFAEFNGDLIICNGVNKPLIVDSTVNVTYLQDLADLSNANTPIARFVVAHGRYLVMTGDLVSGNEDIVYISNTDTSGTWLGDSAPNDAVNVSLGSRVPSGSHAVKGLGRFRDQLIVLFENAVLPGTLGTFVSSVHTPTFDDAIENLGGISHRIIQTVGEDMVFVDTLGASSVKRALFTGAVTSKRTSYLIDPELHEAIDDIGSVTALEDRVWSLWDGQANNYMLFIPNADEADNTTEYKCFVHKRNEALKIDSWHLWRNWNFRSGCISALKRVFMTEGTQVYVLGEETHNQVYKDYQGAQEMWDDDTPWLDYTGWTPVVNIADSGIPIKFVWELPWSDHNQRFLTKNSRYINFDTEGDNKFLCEMYIDNIYEDRNDLGEDWQEDTLKFDDELGWDVQVLDPTLSMEFEGGSAPGFGNDQFGEDFGGGRPTRLESLYAWRAKYKLEKLRMSGDATKALKFVSISLAYLVGSIRR